MARMRRTSRSRRPCARGDVLCAEPGRSHPCPDRIFGPAREGISRTPSMHVDEKSDEVTVPRKRPNKGRQEALLTKPIDFGTLRSEIDMRAALTAIATLTRARGARRFQRAVRPSCAEQTDRLEPAIRLWSTSPFLFSGLLLAVWFGTTMELGRSMMSAGAGAARATGSSTTDRKICSTDSGGAYSRSRSAAAARH